MQKSTSGGIPALIDRIDRSPSHQLLLLNMLILNLLEGLSLMEFVLMFEVAEIEIAADIIAVSELFLEFIFFVLDEPQVLLDNLVGGPVAGVQTNGGQQQSRLFYW